MLCNECVERKLRKAGASSVYVEDYDSDFDGEMEVAADFERGKFTCHLNNLPLARAEAALRAATGNVPPCQIPADCYKVQLVQQQLAAANKEVERLKAAVAKSDKIIGQLRDVVAGQDKRISRTCEVMSQSWLHANHCEATTAISTADTWLARNKETQ